MKFLLILPLVIAILVIVLASTFVEKIQKTPVTPTPIVIQQVIVATPTPTPAEISK